MMLLLLCLLTAHLGANAGVISTPEQKPRTLQDIVGVNPLLFESEIRAYLEKLRGILKNGDPANNIPVLEPLPLDYFSFDFILEESRLDGYIKDVFVHNISEFIIDKVEFDVFSINLELDLSFDRLTIDGGYRVVGNLFEEPLMGEGTFVSVTDGLKLLFHIDLDSDFSHTVAKVLSCQFSFINDDVSLICLVTHRQITFKNTLNGNPNSDNHLDNAFLQNIIADRIQNEYFPLLLHTLSALANDILYDYALDDLVRIIIGILEGEKDYSSTLHAALNQVHDIWKLKNTS